MPLQEEYFEQILDRRLGDFEKVVETRLNSIQDGVNRMQETMTVFVQQVSNLHVDYIPRKEQEKEQVRAQKELDELKKKVEILQAWRNTLAGAVGFMLVAIGWVIQAHLWK